MATRALIHTTNKEDSLTHSFETKNYLIISIRPKISTDDGLIMHRPRAFIYDVPFNPY